MKTPHLIGILLGILVFIITITTVIILLIKSNTFQRLQSEIITNKDLIINNKITLPQMNSIPELHEHLLIAKKKLTLKFNFENNLKGKFIILKNINNELINELYQVGNGKPCFDESAYDPERLWGWLPNFYHEHPYESLIKLTESLITYCDQNTTHLAIIDQQLNRVIGMISLTKNDPANLSIQIGNYFFFVNSKLFIIF